MEFIERGENAIIVLSLDQRPRYVLSPGENKRLSLTLFDVSAESTIIDYASGKQAVSIDGDEKSTELRLHFDLTYPLYQIDSSWLDDEKVHYIKISFSKDGQENHYPQGATPDLKGVLFGFKDKGTRMVMGLDRKPLWNINIADPRSLAINLYASSTSIDDANYGPVKWLREVKILRQNPDETGISLGLDYPANRVKVFWMKEGSRLVMDIFEETESISDETLISSFKVLLKEDGKTASGPENESVQTVLSDEALSSGSDPAGGESSYIVRMKIH